VQQAVYLLHHGESVRVGGSERLSDSAEVRSFLRAFDGISDSSAGLACQSLKAIGRILIHVHTAKLPSGRQSRVARVLFGLPSSFDALDAIQTWDSAFWNTSAVADAAAAVTQLPFGSMLNEAGLRDFLRVRRQRDLAETALAGLIENDLNEPVRLVAESETVAWIVYSAALALPSALRRRLTFATYTNDAEREPAILAGKWQRSNEPVQNHSGAAAPYAHFTVQQLVEGRSLSPFLRLCDECAVATSEQLQDLFALENAPARLEHECLLRLIDRAETLPRVQQSPPARQRFQDWLTAAMQDPNADVAGALLRVAKVLPSQRGWSPALIALAERIRAGVPSPPKRKA